MGGGLIWILIIRALGSEVLITIADAAPHDLTVGSYGVAASAFALARRSAELAASFSLTSFEINFFNILVSTVDKELVAPFPVPVDLPRPFVDFLIVRRTYRVGFFM